MRHHRAVVLLVTGSFLLSLASCAADSMKSSSETPSISPIAQAEEGKDQPPSGEIQERAVPRMAPGVTAPFLLSPAKWKGWSRSQEWLTK